MKFGNTINFEKFDPQTQIFTRLKEKNNFVSNYGKQLHVRFDESQIGIIKVVLELDYKTIDAVFCNGIQSWSESRFYKKNDSIKSLRPIVKPIWNYYKMQQYGDHHLINTYLENARLYSFQSAVFQSDQQYIKIDSQGLSQVFKLYHYDIQNNNLEIILFCNDQNLDNFKISLSPIPKEKQLKKQRLSWTSWYNYYTDITPELLSKNLQNFKNKIWDLEYFQIDDGWQQSIGDWQPNDKFVNQMKRLVAEIGDAGSKPGLWLAPFVVEQKSYIYKDHPDWIRTINGKQIIAGRNDMWSGYFYVLEWKNIEVQSYLRTCFSEIIKDWGFQLLKLDFLYATAIMDETLDMQDYQESIAFLKDITQGAQILACGANFTPVDSAFDLCRVGGDVGLIWEDWRLSPFLNYRERVSTLANLRNTIHRRLLMDVMYQLDPDVFILRSENNKLTKAQKHTLFYINWLLGDVLFTSDNIQNYDQETISLINHTLSFGDRKILDWSLKGDTGIIYFVSTEKKYALAFNLSKNKVSVSIAQDYKVSESKVTLLKYESKLLSM